MTETVRIGASYMTCCFCEKPHLADGEPVPYRPYRFKRAVRAFAELRGLLDVRFAKYDNVATAILPAPCTHRQEQIIRLETSF